MPFSNACFTLTRPTTNPFLGHTEPSLPGWDAVMTATRTQATAMTGILWQSRGIQLRLKCRNPSYTGIWLR